MFPEQLKNYINGAWQAPEGASYQEVVNPATQEVLSRVPLSTAQEVDLAVQAAQAAYPGWRKMLPADRAQFLYRMKAVLEQHIDELAQIITLECGKTLAESRAELKRAIENVEVACGIPTLLQGTVSEQISNGIDEMMIRQPVGVCAAITPFNFPGMIPFWFMPYALACGNPFIVKPSERVPLTMHRVFELLEEIGLPPGVLSLVNGSKDAVDALLDHPLVRGISFVGSTPVARYVYSKATASGKRAQCQGGAKNPVVVLPDADLDMTTRVVADSAFGCAGQRCLAASLAITVGEKSHAFTESIAEAARQRVTGYGLEPGVQMGPVITSTSKERIESIVEKEIHNGVRAVVDGRNNPIPGYENGNFIRPTILDQIPAGSPVLSTEIFGPVLGLLHVNSLDEAIEWINRGTYGNMACIFTSSGAAARKFRHEVEVGNVGVNLGVAAPIATFPFSGWKQSFFGDLHGQSHDAIDFFTQKKVVIERWPKEWSRVF